MRFHLLASIDGPAPMQSLSELIKRQKALSDFGDFALDHEDLEEILNEGCRLVAEALSADLAKVLEINRTSDTALVRAGVGWKEGIVGKERISLSEQSSEAYAIRQGEPTITKDIKHESRFHFSRFLKEHGVIALVNVPIFLPGRKPWGVLQVDLRERRDFEQEDIEFLKTYAMVLGPVIDRLEHVRSQQESEAKYRSLFESLDEGYMLADVVRDEVSGLIDIFFVEANQAAIRIAGQDFTGRSLREIDSSYEDDWYELYYRAASTGVAARAEHYAAPHGRWFAFHIARVGDERSRRVAVVFQDVTERKLGEAALRESEEKYAALFAASPAPFLILRPDTPRFTIADVNDAYLATTMRNRKDLIGCGMFDAFPDNPHDPAANGEGNLRAALERVLISKQFELMEVQKYDIARPDGTFEERWWKPANSPVLDADGNVLAIIHHVADVTAEHRAVEGLRASERHAQTLLAELQHRVRNLLAMIRSVIRRASINKEDVADFVDHLEGRIDAMARTQSVLTRSPGVNVDLRTIIEEELLAQSAQPGQYVAGGPETRLAPKVAEVVTLAIHELATNSVKYGAIGRPGAFFFVDWRKEQRGEERWLTITWRETGVPIEGKSRSGFGTELLTRRVPFELGGKVDLAFMPDGLEATLDFPLRQASSVLQTDANVTVGE